MVQAGLSTQNKRLFQGELRWGENDMAEVCWEREVKPEEEECGERVEALSSFQGLKNKRLHKKETWQLLPKCTKEQSAKQKFPVA